MGGWGDPPGGAGCGGTAGAWGGLVDAARSQIPMNILFFGLKRAFHGTLRVFRRALASLEELGLVAREVAEEDRRQRYVVLTKAGRRSVLRAARSLIHSGVVDLTIDSALSPALWHDAGACWTARHECLRPLRLLRLAYRDLATPDYPFAHCEDGGAAEALDELPPFPRGPTHL